MKRLFFLILISLLTVRYTLSTCLAQGVTVLSGGKNVETCRVKLKAHFPNAKEVIVEGSFYSKDSAKACNIDCKKGGYVMEKNGDDWTCTTQPLPSEMYTYRFLVDGCYKLDPSNSATTRDVADTLNYFFVPGKVTDYYIDRNIPHGTIEKIWYPSTMNGMSQRRMFVYLPAEYKDNPGKEYSVLYLLHGSGGDETSWCDMGRASQILDYMMDKGMCKPMIVVMPNGNVNLDAAPGESPYMDKKPTSNNMSSMFGIVETAFPKEVIRYIEQNYRVIPDKAHRAIAGLSLGGLQTLFIAANNPDTFDYVGLFSAQTKDIISLMGRNAHHSVAVLRNKLNRVKVIKYVVNGNLPRNIVDDGLDDTAIYENLEQKLLRQYQTPPKLYYVAIGRDDFMMSEPLKKRFSTFTDIMDANKLPYEYHVTSGSHSWENWRKYLVDFLPKLFQP